MVKNNPLCSDDFKERVLSINTFHFSAFFECYFIQKMVMMFIIMMMLMVIICRENDDALCIP